MPEGGTAGARRRDAIDDWAGPSPEAPDVGVRRLAIVGVGLIGGSIALAAKRAWPGVQLAAVDRGAALDAARLLPAFDRVSDRLDALRGADMVVLAAPVRQNIAMLAEIGAALGGPALVTDAGSTKRETVAASAALPPHVSFVGGHPLAGAARGGLSLARADLFAGRPWLVTAGPATRSPEDVRRVERFAAGLGAEPRTIGADEHDRLLAFLSHLPQLAASALMETVGAAAGDHIDLAGPGLADTTRLAASPVDIWQDICATNADDIRPALDALIDALRVLRDGLDDPAVVSATFESARAWRERLTHTAGHERRLEPMWRGSSDPRVRHEQG
jgi:prephenate dehydrogenase